MRKKGLFRKKWSLTAGILYPNRRKSNRYSIVCNLSDNCSMPLGSFA